MYYVMHIYTSNTIQMASILKQIHHLSFHNRQTISVRRETLTKINKLIGAAMYHNSERVSKSDIFAYSVDHLYNSVMKELATFDL